VKQPEIGALAAGKPVFFYLWPQYHDGTPKQFQYIDTAYWTFQLETSYRDADGIVLWGPSRFPWDESSGWWAATLDFIRQVAPANIAEEQVLTATGAGVTGRWVNCVNRRLQRCAWVEVEQSVSASRPVRWQF
jgi:hypothetical protein